MGAKKRDFEEACEESWKEQSKKYFKNHFGFLLRLQGRDDEVEPKVAEPAADIANDPEADRDEQPTDTDEQPTDEPIDTDGIDYDKLAEEHLSPAEVFSSENQKKLVDWAKEMNFIPRDVRVCVSDTPPEWPMWYLGGRQGCDGQNLHVPLMVSPENELADKRLFLAALKHADCLRRLRLSGEPEYEWLLHGCAAVMCLDSLPQWQRTAWLHMKELRKKNPLPLLASKDTDPAQTAKAALLFKYARETFGLEPEQLYARGRLDACLAVAGAFENMRDWLAMPLVPEYGLKLRDKDVVISPPDVTGVAREVGCWRAQHAMRLMLSEWLRSVKVKVVWKSKGGKLVSTEHSFGEPAAKEKHECDALQPLEIQVLTGNGQAPRTYAFNSVWTPSGLLEIEPRKPAQQQQDEATVRLERLLHPNTASETSHCQTLTPLERFAIFTVAEREVGLQDAPKYDGPPYLRRAFTRLLVICASRSALVHADAAYRTRLTEQVERTLADAQSRHVLSLDRGFVRALRRLDLDISISESGPFFFP